MQKITFLLELTACFQDIPLSNKTLKTVFCLYEDWTFCDSVKFAVVQKREEYSGRLSHECQKVFSLFLWVRLCIRPPGAGYCTEGGHLKKISSIFCHLQASSAAWGAEHFAPSCSAGMAMWPLLTRGNENVLAAMMWAIDVLQRKPV